MLERSRDVIKFYKLGDEASFRRCVSLDSMSFTHEWMTVITLYASTWRNKHTLERAWVQQLEGGVRTPGPSSAPHSLPLHFQAPGFWPRKGPAPSWIRETSQDVHRQGQNSFHPSHDNSPGEESWALEQLSSNSSSSGLKRKIPHRLTLTKLWKQVDSFHFCGFRVKALESSWQWGVLSLKLISLSWWGKVKHSKLS